MRASAWVRRALRASVLAKPASTAGGVARGIDSHAPDDPAPRRPIRDRSGPATRASRGEADARIGGPGAPTETVPPAQEAAGAQDADPTPDRAGDVSSPEPAAGIIAPPAPPVAVAVEPVPPAEVIAPPAPATGVAAPSLFRDGIAGTPLVTQVTTPAFAMGADRATGLIPDHGARHLPRALWLGVYGIAIVGPFVLVLLRDPSLPRPFMFELGSGLGIAALSLLALQLVLPARMPVLSAIGAEVAVRLHRRLADIMLAVVAAHVVAVMIADPARLRLLQFFGEPWRAQAAIGSVAALTVLVATSILRRRVRLSYAWWRAVHVLLGALALVLAVVHTIGVGRYLVAGPAGWALIALTIAGLGALVVMRSQRLRGGSLRPYTVERVVAERGGAVTLQLVADGHLGQRFIPGQFAWLKLPHLRASMAEHPFSYSSSAEAPDRPTFTMKTMAGFSAEAAAFRPGVRLLVDGPHGAFRPRATSTGTLLVAGGIGITPSMSILRTAADRGDGRPYLLVYGARSIDSATFSDELAALPERMNLTVVLVLSSPPPDWGGERGRINAGVLDRHLPADLRGWQFMVCGSGPFVDGALLALESIGVPGERVHAERFVEV
jgi:predicted ferric reductase